MRADRRCSKIQQNVHPAMAISRWGATKLRRYVSRMTLAWPDAFVSKFGVLPAPHWNAEGHDAPRVAGGRHVRMHQGIMTCGVTIETPLA